MAALLYVDDTDLLHKPAQRPVAEIEIVKYTQQATHYWAKLLQATGGNLKTTKCYWYLLSYKFVKGTASLKTLQDLPRYTLTIPQTDGGNIAIKLKDAHTASQVLGIWSSPSSTDNKHLDYMVQKGQEWTNRMKRSTLDTQDAWQSFSTQALPSVKYGLVTLMSYREDIDDHFHAWYYQCLPSLGINRSISKVWRTLPPEFQGLGLPNMSLEKLAASITLLRQHWNNNTAVGQALRGTYELCQLEIGLGGNFLEKDYNRYNVLASHTWFKVLWDLLDHYKVKLILMNTTITPPRERDYPLMEHVIQTLPRHHWTAFNRVRRFYKVYFMSQITRCDGKTINPAYTHSRTITASSMRFSTEQPTERDFEIWISGLKSVTSPTLHLSHPLGAFVTKPYQDVLWKTTPQQTEVIHSLGPEHHRVYKKNKPRYHTRNHNSYQYHKTCTQAPPWTHYASVSWLNPSTISLHSWAVRAPSKMTTSAPFLHYLRRHDPARFFDHNPFDSKIEWILTSISLGSLIIAHDGSYMPHLSNNTCSAAVVFLCTKTGKLGAYTVCEKTDEYTASNYRGELLGGLIATHLLVTAVNYTNISPNNVLIYCDNMGVVQHGNNPIKHLSEKQSQADVLAPFRLNLTSLAPNITYRHVIGHSDSTTAYHLLTIPEQLNVIADILAQECLQARALNGPYSHSLYPNEPVRIYIEGRKITASIKAALYTKWGKHQARTLFHKRGIVDTKDFNLVFWDGLRWALQTCPKSFQRWVTKHVSHFCGTNRQLSKMDSTVKNICMCCNKSDESTSHITRCRNKGRVQMFNQSTQDLLDWMDTAHGNTLLTESLATYLHHRGRRSMKSIVREHPELHNFARDHDKLGWDNFMEGRICTALFQLQASTLTAVSSKWTIKSWSCHFIKRVLSITHRQWLYRNARIHIRLADGLTEPEHKTIIQLVQDLLHTDPNDLLPQHRYLLQQDFRQLGVGPSLDRQYWITSMQSAIAAADIVFKRT
jgi:hypothetical protein